MTRIHSTIAFVFVATIGWQGLQAQGQPGPSPMDVTVIGCISQAERTGSLADDSGAGVVATPNTAPVDANSAEPVDAFLLTHATATTSSDAGKRPVLTSYTLEGREKDLSQHKGHRVEVTGRRLPPRGSVGASSTKSTAPGIERIAVRSVKMLSPECPAAR
jgi:hypothetical protein